MLIFFLFIIGLAVGSFLNVCADRLSHNKSILGRSKCDFCHKKLAPVDLIPLLSFAALRGRCRYCRRKLSIFYPITELATGAIFVFLWLQLSLPIPEKIAYLILFCIFIAIFFADLKYHVIPDELQIGLLIVSLAIFVLRGSSPIFIAVQVVQGVIVATPMYLLYAITRGKGLGFGDVKLSFVIGFLLGWMWGLIALYIGFVFGAVIGSTLLISRQKKWKSKIALGPFLIIGTIMATLYSKELMLLFLRLMQIQ